MGFLKMLTGLAFLLAVIAAANVERVKRVVGGAPYAPGDYPFSVSLWYMRDNNFYTEFTPDRHHTCGGSLITEDWVLTSAICFDDLYVDGVSNLSNWHVVLGMYNQVDAEREAQFLKADRIFVLPEYDRSAFYGDMALLKLSVPANLSDPMVDTVRYNTDPSCPKPGDECTLIGWGQTSEVYFGNGSYIPNEVIVYAEETSVCAATYGDASVTAVMGDIRIDKSTICAGVHPHGGKDGCYGDSGSPLLARCGDSGELVIVGTAVTGYGCARPGFSGIYCNAAHFSDWINATISSLQ